jgi:hypothetical protein
MDPSFDQTNLQHNEDIAILVCPNCLVKYEAKTHISRTYSTKPFTVTKKLKVVASAWQNCNGINHFFIRIKMNGKVLTDLGPIKSEYGDKWINVATAWLYDNEHIPDLDTGEYCYEDEMAYDYMFANGNEVEDLPSYCKRTGVDLEYYCIACRTYQDAQVAYAK